MPIKTRNAAPDFSDAMARLRAIAEASTDSLLTEGPVHPDHRLLDLCATALHHLGHAQKAFSARNSRMLADHPRDQQAAVVEEADRLFQEYQDQERLGTAPLGQIRKIKATTAAGIYAKAAVVRASKTGATHLAKSLADDLLDCPGLRESLWPVEVKGGDQ